MAVGATTDGLPRSDSEAIGVGTVEGTEGVTQPIPTEEHPPMNVATETDGETGEGTGQNDELKVAIPNSDCRNGTIESPLCGDPGVSDTGSHTRKRYDLIESIMESPDIKTE